MTAPTPLERLTTALADRYDVTRELGAGGMATVYLAQDRKHDREVAIKVLHPDLGAALGGERFLAEIKTTARLQHPHILPLLDSGVADGLLYYVMPFVRGETLRTRLDRERQLPISDAVRIAREVAGALEHAHQQGIIHRDVKPENILLQDGAAVVADFGIALAVQTAGGARMTQTGLSLGTPQYMSPEQAMGERTIDARSDIYALGAVTYEMLTGEPPFTGATAQSIVAKVLSSVPARPSLVRPSVPSTLDHAVMQALEKLPADRQNSVREFMRTISAEALSSELSSRAPSPVRHPWKIAAVTGVVGLVAMAAAYTLVRRQQLMSPAVQRVTLWSTDRTIAVGNTDYLQAVLSPDGSLIVYADSTSAGWTLFAKRRDRLEPSSLAEIGDVKQLIMSPDGQSVGVLLVDGRFRLVQVDGGTVTTLQSRTDLDVDHAAWLEDRQFLLATDASRLRLFSKDGVQLRQVPLTSRGVSGLPSIVAVPGGRYVVVERCRGLCPRGSTLFLVDLETGSERELLAGARRPQIYKQWLVFVSLDGALQAQRLDPDKGTIFGARVTLAEGPVSRFSNIARDGTLLYQLESTKAAGRSLVLVDRTGQEAFVDSTWTAPFSYPAVSPDGKSFVVTVSTPVGDELWLRRESGVRTRLRGPGPLSRPAWFADGTAVLALASDTAGKQLGVYRVPLDGGIATPLIADRDGVYEAEVSRDAKWLAYRLSPAGGWQLRWRRVDGQPAASDSMRPNAAQLALSPDDRLLAAVYGAQNEIVVFDFPTSSSAPFTISRGTRNSEPRWSRDGRELFFVNGGRLMAVTVSRSTSLETSDPRPLFGVTGYEHASNRQMYDVLPDGRFLMIKRRVATATAPLVLADRWIDQALTLADM